MFVVTYRKFFLGLSVFFVIASILSVSFFGLKWGIDFTGGSLLEVEYQEVRPEIDTLKEEISAAGFTTTTIQPTGARGMIFRTRTLTEDERIALHDLASQGGATPFTEKRFSTVGGVIGEELRSKAWVALALSLLAIVLYIAFAFRKVSKPVSSWKFGLVAIIALLHNIIIPVGFFALLGNYFQGYQIDVLFVTALLAIFGFSVNDTIVIFDRIRENLGEVFSKSGKTFEVVVGESISQTLSRSINISLAIIFVLLTLYFLGGVSTREFAFVLGLGVLFGTYSSICFAAPLLVFVERWQKNKK